MSQRAFKQCLEPFVGVSAEHFKIYRSYIKHSELECSTLSDSLDIYKDNDHLKIKIERALKKGEYCGNVFLLVPNEYEVTWSYS